MVLFWFLFVGEYIIIEADIYILFINGGVCLGYYVYFAVVSLPYAII